MNPKAVVVGITLLILAGVGFARRRGTWHTADWLRFGALLILSAALVLVAIEMASAVDQGFTRGWGIAARLVYVVAMILLMLYGAVLGVRLLRSFAEDETPSLWYKSYFFAFAALTLVLGGAAALEEIQGIAFGRSGAVVLGLFSLWLGLRPPAWFEGRVEVHVLYAVLGAVGTRILYVALGLILVLAGLAGVTTGLFR